MIVCSITILKIKNNVQTIRQQCNLLFDYHRFNAGLALGELFGPIAAGVMLNNFSFDRTFSLLGFAVLIFGLFNIPLVIIDLESKKLKRDTRENSLIIK
jgi:hypothetical protein